MPAAPILEALDQAKQDVAVQGKVLSVDRPYVSQLADLKKDIKKAQDENGEIPLRALRQVRQSYDKYVGKSNFAIPPEEASRVGAVKEAADTIRSEFAAKHPDLADDNREYSFYKNLHEMADSASARQTGRSGGLLRSIAGNVLGGAVGVSTHSPTAALATRAAVGKLSEFANSALWNTLKANQKARVATLVQAGSYQEALQFAQQAAVGGLANQGASKE